MINELGRGLSGVGFSVQEIWPNVPKALIAFIVGYILVRILAWFLKIALRWTHWPIGLQEIMETLIKVALWVFLVITILQVLGLSNVALAITGSFAVLLVGFSSGISNTINDLVAGLQLANDKDFKVGYRIQAGDKKTEGIIREMDIKKTRIEDEKGHLHVIPNGLIEKNEWVVIERHVHSRIPKKPSAIIKAAIKQRSKKS